MIEMIRMKDLQKVTSYPRMAVYRKMKEGLLPRPISMGLRMVAWPKSEIETVMYARISGKGDDEIRKLVVDIMNARRSGVRPSETHAAPA